METKFIKLMVSEKNKELLALHYFAIYHCPYFYLFLHLCGVYA